MSVEDVDLGWVSGNEIAEGMHAMFWRHVQQLGAEMAIDPAGAHDLFGGVCFVSLKAIVCDSVLLCLTAVRRLDKPGSLTLQAAQA